MYHIIKDIAIQLFTLNENEWVPFLLTAIVAILIIKLFK